MVDLKGNTDTWHVTHHLVVSTVLALDRTSGGDSPRQAGGWLIYSSHLSSCLLPTSKTMQCSHWQLGRRVTLSLPSPLLGVLTLGHPSGFPSPTHLFFFFPFIHSLIHLHSDQQVFIYSVSVMHQVLVIQDSKLLSRIYKGLACKPILAVDTVPIFDS